MQRKAGIRNFFASVLAGNQKGFGRAIAKTTIPRKDIFICGSVNTGGCSGKANCKTQTAFGCEVRLSTIHCRTCTPDSTYMCTQVRLNSWAIKRWNLLFQVGMDRIMMSRKLGASDYLSSLSFCVRCTD